MDGLRTLPLQAGNAPADRPIHVFENVSGLNRIYEEHRGALDVTADFAFVYDGDKDKDAKVAAVLQTKGLGSFHREVWDGQMTGLESDWDISREAIFQGRPERT